MTSSVSDQKKRPDNSAGSAWLRGGQTIAHTYDMIVELWGKLRWVLLAWAALCWLIADRAAVDGDQLYAGLHFVAWFYVQIGEPLPQSLSVADPSGMVHLVQASAYDRISFVDTALQRYFGLMWKAFWLWSIGTACMVCGLSYAFIRSGDAKLESHDIRGQQIVALHILVALIRRYNLAKTRDINHETVRAFGWARGTKSTRGQVRAAIDRLVQKAADLAYGLAELIERQARGRSRAGDVANAGARAHDTLGEVRPNADQLHRLIDHRRWAEERLSRREAGVLALAQSEANQKGLPFFRRPSDFHRPQIAQVPYPFRAEYEHTLVVGGTGAGKSVAIHGLIDSIRARGDTAFIYDPEGEFIRAHFREGDRIFNPFDARSVPWSPYMDLVDLTHWQSSAVDLYPDPKTGDPYWTLATRTIYAYAGWLLGTKTRASLNRNPRIGELLTLLVGPHDKLYAHLKDTPAANTLGEKAGPRSDSLRSVLITGVERLSHLLGTAETFSMRTWINDPNEHGFMFLSAPEDLAATIKPILAHLSALTITALLSRDPDQSRKTTWIILDEFTSLGKMDSLADSPARLRKFGGCMVVGMQQISQIEEIYGEPKARSIVGQLRNKLILACGDPKTGEFMSNLIGKREVRRIEETTSYGANNIRDGVGLAPKDSVEPIAMPEQIQRLATRTGYIMFSPGQQGTSFPVSLVTYPYVARPTVAPAFVPHNRPNPIEVHYLRQLAGNDDALGGKMSPAGPWDLDADGASHATVDKEAHRDDVDGLAPVETDAVRSAPHQHIAITRGRTARDLPSDALPGRLADADDAKEQAVLDALNDLINGHSPGEI